MGLRTYPPSAWRNAGAPVSNYRVWLDSVLRSDAVTVADYDASLGITGTLNASAWANQIGAAGPLLQATGANQLIHLAHSGTNYLWLPGVAGNYASALDSVALSFSSSFDGDVYIAADDWTPAANRTLIGQDSAGSRGWQFVLLTSGKPYLYVFDTASNLLDFTASVAPTIADGSPLYVRFKLTWALTGNVTCDFSTSTDGVSWAALGTQQTSAATGNAVRDSSAELGMGFVYANNPFSAKLYRSRLYSGDRSSGGTLVFDANFTQAPEGATTFTESSANAATVTIVSSGAEPAQIVGSASLLANGSQFMQAAFTANQPVTVYAVMKPAAYSGAQIYLAGTGSNTSLYSTGVGTNYEIYAGSSVATAAGPAAGGFHIFQVQWNGANSFWNVDGGTNNTGNAGANNPGGLTVGSAFDGTFIATAQYKKVVARLAADNAPTQAQIIGFLRQIYGTP